MSSWDANGIQFRACQALERDSFDFSQKLYAAYDLNALAARQPPAILPRSVTALQGLLRSKAFDQQRQRLFLFREAAGALAALISAGKRIPVARLAYEALITVLAESSGMAHQAAAEALGCLPVGIHRTEPVCSPIPVPPLASWDEVAAAANLDRRAAIRRMGRSLVADAGAQLLVVKMARTPADGESLLNEVGWMCHLGSHDSAAGCPNLPVRFELPRPLQVNHAFVFKLRQIPTGDSAGPPLVKPTWSIAFFAPRNYFDYPNTAVAGHLPGPARFGEIIGRNAFLLGLLCTEGIGHQAPIALFHNRVQQDRRRDGGLYEWYRGGRLDRWLASCTYPNFGESGLRDFEHLAAIHAGDGSPQLYRLIGTHLLSLLLVIGSYFRNRDPACVGRDERGDPMDARHLFDPGLLRSWIDLVFNRYYRGFVGHSFKGTLAVDIRRLADRMIDEMGVDRYMEEILRAVDQQHMSQPAFEAFLSERGYAPDTIAGLQKGADDLVILTGPHLGRFNRPISLPELIEAVAAMSAACVCGRFWKEAGAVHH